MTSDQELNRMLRDSADDFLARHKPLGDKRSIYKPMGVDMDTWSAMAEMGWLGLLLPEQLGGLDQTIHQAAIISERLGYHGVAAPFVACSVLPALLLSEFAEVSFSRAEEYAAYLASGQSVLSVAWQEKAGQLDVDSASVTAQFEEGELKGRKQFVVGFERSGKILVNAIHNDEHVLLAIEAVNPNINLDLHASGLGQQAHIEFCGVEIEDMCSHKGCSTQEIMNRCLDGARVAVAAQLAGLASRALEMTVNYVSQREQFGRAIGSFQTVQHRCVDMHILCELAHASWTYAAHCLVKAPESDVSRAAVSAAKARCSDAALQICRTSVQLHGAMGFTEEADIGQFLRQALHLSSWLGNGPRHRRRFFSLSAAEDISYG